MLQKDTGVGFISGLASGPSNSLTTMDTRALRVDYRLVSSQMPSVRGKRGGVVAGIGEMVRRDGRNNFPKRTSPQLATRLKTRGGARNMHFCFLICFRLGQWRIIRKRGCLSGRRGGGASDDQDGFYIGLMYRLKKKKRTLPRQGVGGSLPKLFPHERVRRSCLMSYIKGKVERFGSLPSRWRRR